MDKTVDNFLDYGLALYEVRLCFNLILNFLQIPVHKLTASNPAVFICNPQNTTFNITINSYRTSFT